MGMAPSVFASSWWGQAWIESLERSARLDPSRLARGRTYARRGAAGAVMIDAGRVRARVAGSHGRHYQTEVEVRRISAATWERVADAIAAKSAHAAAFADGELDPAIVDDVAAIGVDLLPGAGDLRPHCTCPDWAEPCKHAAAVCYLVAAELDRDPFLVFLLRGISRDELVALLDERRPGSRRATSDAPGVRGVVAADVWRGRSLDEPSSLLDGLAGDVARRVAVPSRPGRPLPWDAAVPSTDAVDPRRVDEAAVDATDRAWLMLADGAPSGLAATVRGDLARRAADAPHPRDLAELAARTRLATTTLSAWAEAWRKGGDIGVEMVADEDAWAIDQHALAVARDQLVELGIPRRSVALNYDSLGMPKGFKVVLGPDGRWYHLRSVEGVRGARAQFHLVSPPSFDITDVVDPPTT